MGKIRDIISNWQNAVKDYRERASKEKEEMIVKRTDNLIRNMNIVVDNEIDYEALKAISNIDPDYIDCCCTFSTDEFGNSSFSINGLNDLKDLINVTIEQNFILMRKVDALSKKVSELESTIKSNQ